MKDRGHSRREGSEPFKMKEWRNTSQVKSTLFANLVLLTAILDIPLVII